VPQDLRGIIKDCQFSLTVQRTKGCYHQYKTKCHQAFSDLALGKPWPKCEVTNLELIL
jgi:hypothetical protein